MDAVERLCERTDQPSQDLSRREFERYLLELRLLYEDMGYVWDIGLSLSSGGIEGKIAQRDAGQLFTMEGGCFGV